ncbi:MAG: glycerol-3-phosphate 1-O-acyltransferase PlsY [Ignavibacteria bacterium]|nr:glycerol-3-phosphate 1-O-acyltransferase PlsY [Ignavibacteria bacterium]
METLFLIISSYLLGSIPTAFILMKLLRNIDIRKAGSGNVGGMNTYEVSGSKLLGFVVFLVDALKGYFAVLLARKLFHDNFLMIGLSVFFVVLGHCYSVWISFKGGRGLATAFGSTITFIPGAFVIWALIWFAVYVKSKDIHLGNIWATISTFILLVINFQFMKKFIYPSTQNFLEYFVIVFLVLGLIFIRHLEPLREILSKTRLKKEV